MNLKLLHLLSFVFGLVLVACTHTTSQQAASSKQKSKSKKMVAVAGPSPNLVSAKNKLDKKPPLKIIPEVLPPGYPSPEPPIPYPEPIDPPGYIPEPPDPEILVVAPKTIRDSIVTFPSAAPSYGNHPDELFKFIDYKIANSAEWSYLKELGVEGKIYIRLLIDTKGKVREVTFLKFTDSQLEILKSRLKNALLSMQNWTPAKNEVGESVVSEYTFPYRIQIE